MTSAVDQRRRALLAAGEPIAAPFTPWQEARIRELVREEIAATADAKRARDSDLRAKHVRKLIDRGLLTRDGGQDA